jgi:hypothetical protein
MEKKEKKEVLPPHKPSSEAGYYILSMTPAQLELHEMAKEKLGSSYFVERSKGFLKWKESRSK